ncbi:SH3 domain-containing protein, partial [Aeromonas veronii]
HSAIDKAMAAMARPSAIDKALQSFTSQHSAIDKAMAAMARPSVIDKALQSFTSQYSAIDKAMAAMARPSAIDKALQSFASQHSTVNNAMAMLVSSSGLENALKGFAKASSVILTEPSCLSEMAQLVSTIDLDSINLSSVEEDLENTESKFNSMENKATFVSVFSKLPPFIQVIFFYFLINIFLPQVNSISANIITPMVENYLANNANTDRQKIKEIKNIPLPLKGFDTNDLRFITGNNVHLRASPSTNSEIYDELMLGQVLTVLTKKRNWIEVMYEHEDGEYKSGWVFTRYTAKFVK